MNQSTTEEEYIGFFLNVYLYFEFILRGKEWGIYSLAIIRIARSATRASDSVPYVTVSRGVTITTCGPEATYWMIIPTERLRAARSVSLSASKSART